MAWAVDLVVVRAPLMDLPVDLLVSAAKDAGAKWGDYFHAPAKDPAAARALIRRAAEHFEVDAPPTDTARQLLACFVEMDSDLEEIVWVNGSPKAEDGPTTAG